jgi:hypothetical protein
VIGYSRNLRTRIVQDFYLVLVRHGDSTILCDVGAVRSSRIWNGLMSDVLVLALHTKYAQVHVLVPDTSTTFNMHTQCTSMPSTRSVILVLDHVHITVYCSSISWKFRQYTRSSVWTLESTLNIVHCTIHCTLFLYSYSGVLSTSENVLLLFLKEILSIRFLTWRYI